MEISAEVQFSSVRSTFIPEEAETTCQHQFRGFGELHSQP